MFFGKIQKLFSEIIRITYKDTRKDPYRKRYVQTHNKYNVRNIHNKDKIKKTLQLIQKFYPNELL